MAFELTGRRTVSVAAILLVAAGLSACTTTEGTNAFTDLATFEREVMTSTAQGVGLVPKEEKPDPTNPRGALVMPKSGQALPAPTEETAVAMLPEDSDTVKVDSTGLSDADLARAKRTKVVSLATPDGRPLTAAELKALTARMKEFRVSRERSIYTPPEQYFTVTANQQDLVCLAADGALVSVNDPACPPEIRKALLKKS
ncbi:MAG: hypothetical protein JNL14_01790 [Devosia sp.]|jgi:hypothetical protein|uniref:hypothetical protein n=1 Tax=Devosia sp. TaxID=1871048 RepID=UPI001A580A25|nr:hypothetical protein [Devosia sp.]MBL8596449.1 hypothetical protein [Devosia sp.]